MKVLLLWVVAAWVIAVTADRPCADYCVYLSSGSRDIEIQSGCNCMYEDTEIQDQLDDTSIYYEPVDYVPVPAYIHSQPFYILNPIIHGRRTYSTENLVIPETVEPLSNTRRTDIELNAENTHSLLNRQEKDIQSNNQRLNSPLYLDLDVESGELERSASSNTFTAEELKQTEQSLLECTKLMTALHFRKKSATEEHDTTEPNHSDEYSQLSDAELTKMIEVKCSHISYIVEKSLNEIKKTQSKLTRITFRMDDEDQQNNKGSRSNDIHNTNKRTYCTTFTENNIQSSVQSEYSESKSNEYNENHEETITITNDYDKNTPDNLNTLSSKLPSTSAASTSAADTQSQSDIDTTTEDVSTDVSGDLIKRQSTTSINTDDDSLLHKETNTLRPTPMTFESSTRPADILTTSTTEQEIIGNRNTEEEFKTTDVRILSENRPQYEEGEVPLQKIITHEFSNNTVQSFINGTEDIPNGDFSDELKYTEIIETEDSNIVPYYTESTPVESESSTSNTETDPRLPDQDITGKLYFVFKNHKIPAKFVQNLNGSLHLGIDGVTICDTLTQNVEPKSALLGTLCNCYKSGNCTQKK